jgi:hypothetical protein
MGSGKSIDVDTVDGKHVDVDGAGTHDEIAIYDVNSRVYDSERLDGYHAGNIDGSIPINNGTLNVNLNADLFEGRHGDVTAKADTFSLRDASGDLKINTQLYTANTIIKDTGSAIELRNATDTGWVDLVINNLTIKGTTTKVNSETVTIADNIVLLNSNVTGAATENGGVQVERGTTGADASLLWDESIGKWKCGLVDSEIEISLKGHHHIKTDIDDFIHKTSHAIGGNDFLSPADIGAVKNTFGTPEMITDVESKRPAAGVSGRLFFASDTKRIWQDINTAWQIIGGQDTIPWTSVTSIPVATSTTPGVVKVGENIFVTEDGTISIANNYDSFLLRREEFVTTEGQTVFNLTKGKYMLNKNAVSIYLFGQKLPNSAFSEVNETSVQLKESVDPGSLVEIEYFHFIDVYPYPVHAFEHLPTGTDPLPEATESIPGWLPAADKAKLNTVSKNAKKVESSTTNGNIKIDDVETQVYRHQTYVHDQSVGSALWTISHNLNRYPSVTVVDTDGYVFMPASIRYVDSNTIEIGLSSEQTGKVFLN